MKRYTIKYWMSFGRPFGLREDTLESDVIIDTVVRLSDVPEGFTHNPATVIEWEAGRLSKLIGEDENQLFLYPHDYIDVFFSPVSFEDGGELDYPDTIQIDKSRRVIIVNGVEYLIIDEQSEYWVPKETPDISKLEQNFYE